MAKLSQERITALKNEIRMAELLNKEKLEPIMQESLGRYIGNFTPQIGRGWDIVLNEVYPIIQNNLPSIFFRNPRAFLKPRHKTYITKKIDPISGKMEEVVADSGKSAKTQEAILNYALTEINYKSENRKTLLDALLFPYGVTWHGYKGDFGMTEEQSLYIKDDQVFVSRLSPLRFIKDPSVTIGDMDKGKWVGRIIDIPLVDLVEDNKLDVDKKLVKGFQGYGEPVKPKGKTSGGEDKHNIGKTITTLADCTDEEFKKSKYARFVKVYEIFLRPTKKEKREGSKGWIVLLTDEQEKPLRINDWKIKAEGFPAKILEFNGLNDCMFGIADVDTYKQIADQKNAIVNLQLRNAQENSKVWVGISKEGGDEKEIESIQRGENTIVLFESGIPRDRMFVASPGGSASSELYLIDQRIQRNLEDKSGVTDLKRGFLQSGEESAASVKLRAAGGGARPAYRQDIMSDFIKGSLHYINQLLKQFTPYKDAVRIVGSLDIEWSENPTKEMLQADTDVEIDAISMLPENPQKELQEFREVLQLAVQAISDPTVRTKLLQEGKTINLSPLIEQILIRLKIRDPDIFRSLTPQESQGFVSVEQLKQAQANVGAALTGQQIPFPPSEEDDHRAKLEVYGSINQILQAIGQVNETLGMLIEAQGALMSQMERQESRPGTKLSSPSVKSV